ncbi:MAG: helix-turn-helix domain-containing protein, partial [Parasphingorhabdus sp.]
ITSACLSPSETSRLLKPRKTITPCWTKPTWQLNLNQIASGNPGAVQKYKSDAFEAIRASASALRKVGAIDKATMRSFDESCLTVPSEIKPAQIKELREANHVSQPVFARYLNTSESTVEKWETGVASGLM